ncbi:DNA polymerase III subunit alpha [Fictibacillus terranigra]|uniref:DNA polymerase III subunit alpha n=1 Tax=Fictibacillus terranigra TaxID=3058424 RepID=A0ABT8E400_9BACL|nr:DNA polymerase III subunit alpha [Fictibacillus sp. CENA-BCM004]MDN4072619.1 DNA polymerase III subunit alpha [Fictibacillus sp. CENA-BCM004]
MTFVPLHIHTEYSLLESSCRLRPLIHRAKELGYPALAITDKLNMYGVIPFYKECLKEGIKPIIGLEVNLLLGPVFDKRQKPEIGKLLLYARNNEGYQNLLKISTKLMQEPTAMPSLQKDVMKSYAAGLLVISAGPEGEIQQFLSRGEDDRAKEACRLYKSWFGPHFYFGVEDHGTGKEKTINLEVEQLSKEENITLAATHETYYIHPDEAESHEVLLCIKNGQKLNDPDREVLPTEEYYLTSPEEMNQRFYHLTGAIEATGKIAAECNVQLAFNQQLIPEFPLPAGVDSSTYLRKLCLKGADSRYGEPDEKVHNRLEYELDIIHRMRFDDYFLIVWDFMKFAHESGMITGPGRGSAAGSLVAYVLQITDVDPIKHDLLFERFLNPERVTMPDIDIDFPDIRRDEVLQYVKGKYGDERVAQIITFGTLAAKAAIRDTARVLNLPGNLIDSVSKQIPSRPGMTLSKAAEESFGLQRLIKESPRVQKLLEVAGTLEGLPRHASTHAAGVIISGRPLTDYAPLQAGNEGIPLTQFSMEWLEEIGLLKMDFLGLRNLTLLEEICSLVKRGTGRTINLSEIPFNDEDTFEMLSRGDTTGIFQLESDGMRRVLQQLQPTEFEDIVAVNALYRPGPMQNIPDYIAGKHKQRRVEYRHPDLKPILKSTYGVIVYQEQIMKIASEMAGFSLGEADLLRRAVSKKKRDVLDREREHFVRGCLKKGHDEQTANGLYDLIVRFADYGFNRSHAAAYSIIAYQLAYLKANYPLYFMAALLSSVTGSPEKIEQYIKECAEKNIIVKPPSIISSFLHFTVEGDCVRFGLLCIKNAGYQAIKHIIAAREQRPYQDLFDVCANASAKAVNKRTLESLIFAGALDDFGQDRACLLATLDRAMEYGHKVQAYREENQFQLFEEKDSLRKPEYVEVPPFKEAERLKFEQEALGFYLSGHPLKKFQSVLDSFDAVTIGQAIQQSARSAVRLGIMVTKARTIKTKKGELMAFLSGSDESGEIEFVAFPKAYKAYHELLQKGQFLLVEGTIEEKDGARQVLLNKAGELTSLSHREEVQVRKQVLYLKIQENLSSSRLNHLKDLLGSSNGNAEVILYYEQDRKSVKLSQLIAPTAGLLAKIKELIGADNVVLKGK